MPFTPRISNPQQQAVADAIAASQLSDRQKQKLWESIGDEKKLLSTVRMYHSKLPVESAKSIWQNRTAGPWEIGEPEPEAPVEEPGFMESLFSPIKSIDYAAGRLWSGLTGEEPTPIRQPPTAAPAPAIQPPQPAKRHLPPIPGTEKTGLPGVPIFMGDIPRPATPGVDFSAGVSPMFLTREQRARGMRSPLLDTEPDPEKRWDIPLPGGTTLSNVAEETAGAFTNSMFSLITGVGNVATAMGLENIGGGLATIGKTGEGLMFQPDPGDGKDFVDDPGKLADPRYVGRLFGNVAGSMVGFAGAGGAAARQSARMAMAAKMSERATRWAATAGGTTVASVLEAFIQAGESYGEALDSGKTPEEASNVAATVAKYTLGPTLALNAVGLYNDSIKGSIRRGAASMLGETAQESSQQVATNVAFQHTVEPERSTFAGVPESALGGAIGGPIGSAIIGRARGRPGAQLAPTDQATPEISTVKPPGTSPEQWRKAVKMQGIYRGIEERAKKLEAEKPPLRVELGDMGAIVKQVKAEEAEFQAREAMVRSQAERALKLMPEMGTMAGRRGITPTRGLLEKPSFKMPPASGIPETSVPRETSAEPLTGEKFETILPQDLAKPGQPQHPVLYGKAVHAKIGDHKVLGQWVIMSNDDLVLSNSTHGKKNPVFPQQLQPRDLETVEAQLKREEIGRNYDPEQGSESYLAKDGSAWFSPDQVALSGNHREGGKRLAYAEGWPSMERYRNWLIENAERFGRKPEEVANIPHPTHGRIFHPSNLISQEEFARLANIEETQGFSASEQATADAYKLTPEMLSLYDAEVGAGLLAESNLDFTRKFIEKIVPSAQLKTFTSGGELTQAGLKRIQNALFAKAYGDAESLKRITDVPGEESAVFADALLRAAPSVVDTNRRIANGDLFDRPIAKEFVKTANLVTRLADKDVDFEDYITNEKLFTTGNELTPVEITLGRFMAENSNAPKKIASLIQEYHDALKQAGSPKQEGFFKVSPPSQGDLLESALRRVEANYEDKAGQRRERALRKKSKREAKQQGELGAIKEQLGIEGPKLEVIEGGRGKASGEDYADPELHEDLLRHVGPETVRPSIREAVSRRRLAREQAKQMEVVKGGPAGVKEQLGAQLARDTGAGERATEVAPRKRRLRDFTISNPTEGQIVEGADAVYQPGRKGKPGTLYVNPAGAKLIAEVILRRPSGERYGAYATPDVTLDTLRRLRGYINKVSKEGVFDNSAIDGLKAVYAQLDAAHKSKGGPVVVATIGTVSGARTTPGQIKRAIRHERAHMAMEELKANLWNADLVDAYEFYGAGVGKEQSWEQFLAHNTAQNIMKKFGYGVRRKANISEVTDEIVADLYANDLKRLGLTQNQADELFMHFLDLLVKDVGPDSADIIELIPNRLRSTYEAKYARKATAEVGNIRPESQWLAGPSRFVSRLREGWARSGLEAPAPAKLPAEELREARGGPDGSIDNAGEVLEGLKRFADRISKKKFGREKPSDNFVIPKPIAAPQELFGITASLRSPSSRYPNLVPETVERTVPQTGETVTVPLRENVRTVINKAIQAEQQQAMDTARRDVTIRLAYRQAGKANEVKLGELLNDPDIQDVPSLLAKFPDTPVAVQKSYDSLRRYLDNERAEIAQAMRDAGQDVPADWGVGKGYFPHIFDGDFYMVDKRTGDVIIADPKQGAYYRSPKDVSDAAVRAVEGSGGQLGYDNIEFKMFNHKFTGDPRVRMTRGQYIRFKNGLADLGLDWESINEMMGTTARVTRGQRQAPFVRKREVGLPGWMNNKGALLMYNRAAQRYKQMVRLRPFLENTKVDLETAAARGEVPKTFVWQWDRYIDAVEGRSDLLTGAINQFVSDKFGAAPFWTERTNGFINGLEAAMKLGFTPVSALVNLFQIPINVMPVVGPEYTWKGFAGLVDPTPAGRALREKVITELGLKEQTSKTETFEAKNLQEFIELMKPDGPADAVHGFIEGVEAAGLFAFNSAEYVIRGTAALGTYKRARNEGYGHEYAMDKARRIITRTAFHLGPADKPYILRVSRAFQPLALFKSFMIKQLEFMGQTASGTGDPGARFDSRKAEMARLLAAIGIFVGIAGFPGGDNLDEVYEWFTGGGAEDVPSSLGPVRSLKENYPRISRGLPGVAADVDLTKMTGFADWFMPQQLSLQTLGGPFASDIANLTAIMKAPEGRDKQRAIDQFWRGASPSIRRFFQAYEAHVTPEHKITDTTGRVIMQDVTLWERAMILFGAMPIRMSQRYDAYEVAQRIVEKTRSLKGFYLDEGARAMEKGDSDQVNHWIQEARNQGFGDVNVPAIRSRMEYMRKDRLVQAERSVSKGAQRDELRRRRESLDQ